MYHIARYCIIFLALTAGLSTLHGRQMPDDAEEIPFQFTYYGTRGDIFVYLYKGQVYIPFLEVLNGLKIYNDYDYGNHIIKGYLNRPDSAYTFDFRIGKGKTFWQTLDIDTSKYLISSLDIYVLPEIFWEFFQLEVKIQMSKLMANATSKIDMPVVIEQKRLKSYSFLQESWESRLEFKPLLYGQSYSMFNGGTLSYDLRAYYSSKFANYSYNTNLGIQILGGDLQVNSTGNYDDFTKLFRYRNVPRWRLGFGDNNWLSAINLGYLLSSGSRFTNLPSLNIRGIQITNEVTNISPFYSTFVYEDHIEAGWEVEIYRNGYLHSRQVTDARGYYRFELPIYYGNSNIELRFYGNRGQYMEKREIIQIPNDFLKPGEIRYTLNIGEYEFSQMKQAELRVSTGLTNWLSNSFSLMKNDLGEWSEIIKSKDLLTTKNLDFYNITSIRILGNIHAKFEYAINNLWAGEINYWSDILGTYRFRHTVFTSKDNRINFRLANSMTEAYIQLPRWNRFPFSLNLNLRRTEYQSYASTDFFSNIFFNISGLMLMFYYNGAIGELNGKPMWNKIQHSVNFNANYYLYSLKSISFLKNLSLGFGSRYDITNHQLQNVNFRISHGLWHNSYVDYTIEKQLLGNRDLGASIQIRMDLPYFRSQTSHNRTGISNHFSQQLSGVIGYNSTLKTLLVSNATTYSNLGAGAANIRVFVDMNDNGRYDEGEQIVEGVNIGVPQASVNSFRAGGMTQVYNLTPYTRYNVFIDSKSIKDPTIVPKITEFSFIADPNIYKNIDVPCYPAGVVEGQVLRDEGERTTGQAGVKVHFMNIRTGDIVSVPVFSDGSFYKLGMVPGEYIAYVDSLQLAILKLKSKPLNRQIAIKSQEGGDFVSDIIFTLSKFDMQIEDLQLMRYPYQEEDGLRRLDDNRMPNIPDELPQHKPEIPSNHQLQTNIQTDEHSRQVEIQSIETFQYNDIRSFQLTKSMRDYLDKAVEYLKLNPRSKIVITGHTDSFGSINDMLELSEQRANTAASYLLSKGVNPNQIISSGEGANSPIASNMTPEGRKKNRRLDIKIIE